jgi:hypothetical protein
MHASTIWQGFHEHGGAMRSPCRAWPRAALLIAAGALLGPAGWSAGAGADTGRPERGAAPAVILDVDVLGLWQFWAAGQPLPVGPSRAELTHGIAPQPHTELLFACPWPSALYVTVESRTPAPGGTATHSFGCAPGEALIAHRAGVSCTAGAGGADHALAPPGGAPAVILLEGAGREEALIGECVGAAGAVAPALIGAALLDPGFPPPGGCERTQSTVMFRGRVTAGGC